MLDHDYSFEKPNRYKSIIKVIGVGGGGSNAVRHMYELSIKDVDFVICNTDLQALNDNPVPNKLQLGIGSTKGLGAGTKAEAGREAAMESREEIFQLLNDHTEMLFITAGMGGGTGTGAAAVIAEIAKELGILTVAIVTAPFEYEGRAKKEQARRGIEALQEHCDTVLIVLNEKLLDIYLDMDVDTAFAHADDVLANAAKSIAEIITKSGKVNADFNDVKTILKNAGQAVMGSATAEGESRAKTCVAEALNSPLLDNRDIRGAKRVLATVSYGSSNKMKMREQKEITTYIEEKIGKEVGTEADMFKLGYIVDDLLGEGMRFTVIAAGFNLSETTVLRPPRAEIVAAPESEVVAEKATPLPVVEAPIFPNGKSSGPEPVVVAPVEPVVEPKPRPVHVYKREDDGPRIRRMIEEFSRKMPTEAELETPAYQRHGILLVDMPLVLDGDVERHQLYE
ncbi:MAG: cell division protein FtsZ [Cytophagaceae bacterium]|nr:cell division protein FtsZ [Cytophagaceae bacterium]